jgi:RNA polymerase sigma-70 factor (ECF subfamily)
MPEPPKTWLPTRRTLLSRLKDWNDQASWREFFNTYRRFIYSVAIKAGLTDAEAQDVVQDTVITVAKQMPEFQYDRAKGSFKNWLQKTARWRIQDHLRQRKRQERVGSNSLDELAHSNGAGEMVGAHSPELEALWQEEWEQNLLEVASERAKRQVDHKAWQVFDFCTMKQWPAAKVAEHVNLFRAQVYSLTRK